MILCLKSTHLTDENGLGQYAVCRNQISHQCEQKISDELGPEKQGPGVGAGGRLTQPNLQDLLHFHIDTGLLRPECNYYQHDMEC